MAMDEIDTCIISNVYTQNYMLRRLRSEKKFQNLEAKKSALL